ncbi:MULTISPECIES: hypothetical protein [unclassified Pseudomonas]|uniref:hypothetical protein n=1 Tax=unclassified Pseudomonas TaxID=196821 RepID=UPI000C86AA1D|nr:MULTISPECIES: hypothetical protein [unclassified Pseudomonas]PMV89753.1 hypothetical protein C1X55_32900 [Pseudomonas sp. GW460-C8]PMW09438.1 hypothetical protein C1X40_32980 [Pseudomonas sp. GW456-11-11-14-TSB2]PMW11107.1 hypothetical protein C1X53_32390 [Pseudomonas sp. GW456-E6]PMW27463.1 hypothetical protein C1X45_33130 [Pseudomonas sp. GW460-7]PMW27542.1 hypothetical protein C1X48_33790 [Pseudomonas sp. FW305-3-2-15-A-R2A1]
MNTTQPTINAEQCNSTQVSADDELTPSQLDEKYNPDGGGEHPDYTRSDWREAVAQEYTLSGYWEWVAHTLSLGWN